MGRGIDVVLFDFGGVVVPSLGPEGMVAHARELGIDPQSLQTILYEGDLWRDISVGKLTIDEFWTGVGARWTRLKEREDRRFKEIPCEFEAEMAYAV